MILIALLIGAIATVVVAWGCAIWQHPDALYQPGQKIDEDRLYSQYILDESAGFTMYLLDNFEFGIWLHERTVQRSRPRTLPTALENYDRSEMIELLRSDGVRNEFALEGEPRLLREEAGWPFRCLGAKEFSWTPNPSYSNSDRRHRTYTAFILPWNHAFGRDAFPAMLPVGVMWRPFLYDTLIYAGVALATIIALGRRRRHHTERSSLQTNEDDSLIARHAATDLPPRFTHPIRRLAVFVATCLALGTVTNVGIGWLCAVTGDPDNTIWGDRSNRSALMIGPEVSTLIEDGRGVLLFAADTSGQPWDERYARNDFWVELPSWYRRDRLPEMLEARRSDDGAAWTSFVVLESGWPLRSLYAEFTGTLWWRPPLAPHRAIVLRKLPPTSIAGPHLPPHLPYGVRPFSFLLNTLFYALVIGITGRLVISLRRAWKCDPNRCRSCGHVLLTEQQRCPECGLTRHWSRTSSVERYAIRFRHRTLALVILTAIAVVASLAIADWPGTHFFWQQFLYVTVPPRSTEIERVRRWEPNSTPESEAERWFRVDVTSMPVEPLVPGFSSVAHRIAANADGDGFRQQGARAVAANLFQRSDGRLIHPMLGTLDFSNDFYLERPIWRNIIANTLRAFAIVALLFAIVSFIGWMRALTLARRT